MKVIKFRGKTGRHGQWVSGFYCRHDFGPKFEKDKLIEGRCSLHDIWTNREWIEVEKSSLGQFTGRKDKNEVEIFENDIVRFYDDIEDELIDGVVKYHEDVCAFMIETDCYEPLFFNPVWEYEVVGNTHDTNL